RADATTWPFHRYRPGVLMNARFSSGSTVADSPEPRPEHATGLIRQIAASAVDRWPARSLIPSAGIYVVMSPLILVILIHCANTVRMGSRPGRSRPRIGEIGSVARRSLASRNPVRTFAFQK